jgi:hypothetical protein
MLQDIYYYVKDYYFEIVIVVCIVFLILYALYTKLYGLKGSWSDKIDMEEEDEVEERPRRRRRGFSGESKGEVECRRVMTKIFDKPFYKARPRFLNNPVTFGTNNLELDCYNEELKIAVEYDGAQHYKFIPHFHKTNEAFMNQRYRDYMKDQMCKENGIYLIRVPYTVKIPYIEAYIIEKLKQLA